MPNAALIAANQKRWDNVRFHQSSEAMSVAGRLNAAKDRYVEISGKTGVPWFIIAVIHERESSQRWDRSLAQGDPWNRVSTHVPRGRGPFSSFEEAAIDALKNCPPYAARWSDWSAGGSLTLLELYNGLGYSKRGKPSPYVWAGTNQYVSGKYVADGVYDPNVVDSQLGCALILHCMGITFDVQSTDMDDGAITEDQEVAINSPKAGSQGDADDAKPAVQSTTIWSAIAAIPTALFGMLTDWKVVAALGMFALIGYIVYERYQKQDIKGIL